MKIIHFTTVHPRTDTRIRIKETASIAKKINAHLSLYVQDGKSPEIDKASGIQIVNTGPKIENRVARMTKGSFRMWQAIRRAQPDVAHFHDPELIPVGLFLKLSGTRVVYDVHENVPETIMKRQWIPHHVRKIVSIFMDGMENLAGRMFDRIVVATPGIEKRFPSSKTVLIQNFPIKTELASSDEGGFRYEDRRSEFVYVGGVSRERAAMDMIEALGILDEKEEIQLHIGGNFQSNQLQKQLANKENWRSVVFHGWVDRKKMAEIFGLSRAGLVLCHPVPNFINSQPTKLFEYMSAGLPVIASDFPIWRQIVEDTGAGLLVDPQDPNAIAKAMQWILDYPEKAKEMGENGKRAVESVFNWEIESKKLIIMYKELLGQDKKQNIIHTYK